ncbi:MAG: pilus assembly PilX N-terminal domain-containing protein [Oleispira sp.]
MPSYSFNHRYNTNKGSTLAISLVILTAITLISVSSLQRSGIQGRMVGNIQHQEKGFHAANGELEEIYQFYATQASATSALSAPLNSFDIVNGEQIFGTVDPGHESSYNSYSPSNTGHSQFPRLAVTSNIQHTGVRNSLVEGFSVGTFAEYGFTVSSQAASPSIGIAQGRTLSSQLIGIKFIAPAG